MIYLKLFLIFLKIGAFTFGGGYAMLPLVADEAAAQGWLDGETMLDFVAVSESTPGPFAVNIATFVGSRTAGVFGAVCATVGVVLPSFIIILIVSKFLAKFRGNRFVSGAMTGIKPAATGLIAAALFAAAATVFFPAGLSAARFAEPSFYLSAGIFALAAVLAFKKLHPIAVVVVCAALGVAAGYAFGL